MTARADAGRPTEDRPADSRAQTVPHGGRGEGVADPGRSGAGAGILTGVGVGPGEADLLTLRAVRVLREADLVVVPVLDRLAADAGAPQGRAEATVRAHVPADRLRRLPFALDDRGGVTTRREAAWDAAAAAVVAAFDGGARAIAFATIGDPNVYSTFGYLAQSVRARRPAVEVRTVPGITAMQDLAAGSGVPLCEGREPLTLLPATAGLALVDDALAGPGTVVVYKGWRRHRELVDVLRRHGRLADAVLGRGLGLPDERVGPVDRADDDLPYLSTLLVPARRDRRGGKL
ncbi:precorrin-2/cobalt-factor-2 C20-methyltransferase [Micromonospora halophytica]|uniref:Precorrin-2/cobalt-factor-2 C20-methyltransferase n=1 Tax=Micromonospora halophytica TaxID=47864 RepID=A0A1C5HHJ0_9ACTN|nr:precorrin-2/cobalt-factor-2 C20-methyltransferase [Micromonospora halophytica]